ncbi:MAG TPA: SRPBCC domain-containing protein [Hyphomicrobiaceae bacterium]|jgi:uncharacterized protein YndB with AHSA1/START domain|nr:SRPBCC domain-containing protein [Hyphomicrobiaceae bacterium]
MPASRHAASTHGAFGITRTFEAPLGLVWKAWSEADQLGAWWGPKGCTIEVASFEFRPGGFFHYAMHYPKSQMWGRFLYREIAASRRIVWLNSFSNEGCGITRAPFHSQIPLEIVNDVTFAEKAGRTTVSLSARPHGATEDEVRTFEGMFAGMEQGYGGTFDQLAQVLANA